MPNIALPGIAATGVLGTPTITGGAAPQNISLPGIAASGTLGALTLGFVASGPQSIALSGITATGTLGVPTVGFSAPPPSGGGGVATPGMAPNRLPYPDVVHNTTGGEALDPRGVQANFERLSKVTEKAAATVESWRVVGAVGQPVFENGWSNFGSGAVALAFRKDSLGRVYIRGLVTGGVALATIFTLPVGYRPLEWCDWVQGCNGAYGQVRIEIDGTVHQSVGAGGSQWVNGIVFFTD